jgi:threonine/homoserine/homoserine lactone efflux protein
MDLWIFVGALVVVYLVPGPDMLLVLQTAATQGRARALAVGAGLALARTAHVALAALGLAALLRTAPWAFEGIRLIGAGYLVWLGLRIGLTPAAANNGAAPLQSRARQSWGVAVRRGLITNISNPKALLFCSVLLPQFIQPQGGSVALQFALLGAVLVGFGLRLALAERS